MRLLAEGYADEEFSVRRGLERQKAYENKRRKKEELHNGKKGKKKPMKKSGGKIIDFDEEYYM